MRHTPGPWIVDTEISEDGPTIHESEHGGILAQTYFDNEETDQLANARLMASAPKMLEVLQDVLKAIQRDEGAGQTYDSYVKNFGHDVENVIRKATGEE